MSDVETYKINASIIHRLIETLRRVELMRSEVDFYGRHREDNIIKAWHYGKKYGIK